MSKSLAFLSTFLLLILASEAQPIETHDVGTPPLDRMTVTEANKLVAQDTIALSIRKVHETKRVVDSILGQKTYWQTEQTNQLRPFVESLTTDLTSMTFTLQRMQHLDSTTLNSDIKLLEKMLVRAGTMFSQSTQSVDKIVPSVLTRKLDDLSAVIDDVIYYVSLIERDTDGARNGGKA